MDGLEGRLPFFPRTEVRQGSTDDDAKSEARSPLLTSHLLATASAAAIHRCAAICLKNSSARVRISSRVRSSLRVAIHQL